MVCIEEIPQRLQVHARHRHVRHEAKDHQHRDGEEELRANVRNPERCKDRLDHPVTTSMLPPACLIAASAAFEKAWARTVSALVSTPRPRTFTGCSFRRTTRFDRSSSGVTVAPASNVSS